MSQEAVKEYLRKQRRTYVTTELGSDGFYRPPAGDTCPQCVGAAWSCNTGAHLKTMRHVALKHGIPLKDLKRYVREYVPPDPGDIVYKALRITADGRHVDSPSANGYIWTSEVLEAECSDCDESPGDRCLCGFYAFWAFEDADEYRCNDRDFVVKMQIGGKIEECDDGVRAQYATIQAVYNTPYENESPEVPALAAEILQVPLIEEERDE